MGRDKKESANKNSVKENVNVELGGMGVFGTTSNEEIAGYRSSGDIENAGQVEKGFKRPEEEEGAKASIKEEDDNS